MAHRWIEVTESAFPWERAALQYLRERLPERDPFRAWSNFEFVADDGSINEVDLLLVSRYKIFLVEIKSRPGRVSGDAGTWTWEQEGRRHSDDNPLLLANRKAKKLKSLLVRATFDQLHISLRGGNVSQGPLTEPYSMCCLRSWRRKICRAKILR